MASRPGRRSIKYATMHGTQQGAKYGGMAGGGLGVMVGGGRGLVRGGIRGAGTGAVIGGAYGAGKAITHNIHNHEGVFHKTHQQLGSHPVS